MPQVIDSEIVAGMLCPACDPRAIGFEADDEQRWIYRHTFANGELVFKCGACGCTFNPGTTRAFGPKSRPLMRETVDALIKPGDCKCASTRMWRAYDLNFIDGSGEEQRVHGFVCLHCGRWSQYG